MKEFNLPVGWTYLSLYDLVDVIGGVSYNPEDITSSGIRIIRGGNIQGNFVELKKDDVYLPTMYRNDENTLQKGDVVLVASTGSVDALGRTATVWEDMDNVQIGAFLRILRPKQQKYAALISSWLSSKHYYKYIRSVAKGTSINNISIDHIKGFKIPIPTDGCLQSFSEFYYAISKKIILNRSINHYLEEMAKQLYDYWFVQFDFPDENGRPYKSSGGKMVWNEKLKREIPAGWTDCTLTDYITIKNGRDHKNIATGQFPVYGSGGKMRTVSEYLYSGESVLIPRKGSLNNIMYVNEAFWTVDTMFYSEMKIPHCAIFIFYSIRDLDFTRWDSGTGVPSMTASTLSTISIISPNSQHITKFDLTVKPLYHRMLQVNNEIEELKKQRDELLPLLMSGQVSVTPLNNDLSLD